MSFLGQVIHWFLTATNWQGDGGVPNRVLQHLEISAASLLVAALIALPVGIVIGHIGRGGNLAINVSNVGRAIPSFALLVIAVQAIGLSPVPRLGIGAVPAFIALVALGVPPIVTNSYLGLREVDADVREAAKGMGMRGRLIVWRIELPIALPFIIAGIRTSAVNIVATATLAAEVGYGGLGRFIVDGFGVQDYPQMFAGAVLVGLLSVLVEFSLASLQRVVVPAGLRPSTAVDPDSKRATTLATA